MNFIPLGMFHTDNTISKEVSTMDFTQIIEIVKQIIEFVKDSGIIEKLKEVAPILIEKGIEVIKGLGA